MDAASRIAIDQQLQGLRGAELMTVASASLAACKDLECQKEVLNDALRAAGSLIPRSVGEGTRLALGVGAGALTGVLRGTLGPMWGRLASLAPAIAGGAVGLMTNDASSKAAGYAVLAGTASAAAGIETYDLGQVLRVKLGTKVSMGATVATPPPAAV